jgi:hypothetical protein
MTLVKISDTHLRSLNHQLFELFEVVLHDGLAQGQQELLHVERQCRGVLADVCRVHLRQRLAFTCRGVHDNSTRSRVNINCHSYNR